MKLDDLIIRVDELLLQTTIVRKTVTTDSIGIEQVDYAQLRGLRTAGLSFIERLFGNTHPYYIEFRDGVSREYIQSVEIANVVLLNIKNELKGGWIFSTKGLVSAEIFSNFLEMANHLLAEGYKDAAAVMIGSVLEEHLRQLCYKEGINTTISKGGKNSFKKANTLNDELASNAVYNKLDHKNVIAWLDLRNNAAHGKYNEYTQEQVKLMLSSVSDFISRNQV
jgi:hypothetical protein